MYTNIESCFTPEINIMLYVNYTSIKKTKTLRRQVGRQKKMNILKLGKRFEHVIKEALQMVSTQKDAKYHYGNVN